MEPASDRPPAPGADDPRVLLVAPHNSYRIAAYADAARRLGAHVLIASRSEHALVNQYFEGVYVDLYDPETATATLLAEVASRRVDAVVASDDATVEIASRVASRLDLPHNPPEASRISRRKDLARARLAAAGVPVPGHRRLDLNAPLEPQLGGLEFPVVVKPLSLSASRGVIRADDPAGLARACERVRAILAREELLREEERRHVLVESFVPGIEVALEGMLDDGELQALALFDKPDPLDGPYFEESYYVTPSRLPEPTQARVHDCVAAACAAYGLRQGPVHAELRLDDGQPYVLEVAARTIGGHCGRLLRFGTGYGLEELVVAQALGRPIRPRAETGAAGVLMIPVPRRGVLRRVEGVGAARRVAHVDDVQLTLREGYELVPLPDGDQYLGFIFARAPDPESAERALREAHAHLNVVTAPVLPVTAGTGLSQGRKE